MLVTGVDIIEIERIERVAGKYGDRFLERIYTQSEREYCRGRAPQLASRFAAKEAIKKCFLSSDLTEKLGLNKIEIISSENGAPVVSAVGDYEYADLIVSISHESDYAIAVAMLVV